MILRTKQTFNKRYLDLEKHPDFLEFVTNSIKRELVNKLMDALEEDELYIVQLSKPRSHEGTFPNEIEYRQDLFNEKLIQCKNCRMNFPWCQKFRDELGGNGFCPYGLRLREEDIRDLEVDNDGNISRIDKVKNVIKNNYNDADCGLFFTRNLVGDPMTTIWEEDGVTIDICYYYSYFEVFGLTEEEENELSRFYDSMKGADNDHI